MFEVVRPGGDLLVGVDGFNLQADRMKESGGRAVGFDEDLCTHELIERIGDEELREYRLVEAVVQLVGGDADDLKPGVRTGCGDDEGRLRSQLRQAQGVADCVACGEELLRECLIDDNHFCCVVVLGFGP